MSGRVIEMAPEAPSQCSRQPVEIDGKMLFIGRMVHARSRFVPGCRPAVVVDFTEDGVCELAYCGGTNVSNVPYDNPVLGDPNSKSWHFIPMR